MIILSLDSTETVSTAALTDGKRLLGQTVLTVGNTHSETLLPAIDHLMTSIGLTYDRVDLYACAAGPGSFTGVRIGAATIKGLAFGRDVPCVGVSALEALAYNLVGFDGILCPVMDARRSQLYNAIFRCRDGVMERLTPDRTVVAARLAEELSAYKEPIYVNGGGTHILCETAEALPNLRPAPELLRYENAYSVALCALSAVEKGLDLTDKTDLVLAPTYLRPSQAERTRNGG
ncbi:MAG: tRNA (adenosine(37)-N6)-threonylcarbamoyltransferase complex dimerization subunit type 1 TsaB [Ruminococcaceae bacterium]|nr:tRNA (adenosine(37)-N6)-threonylcarbamoyltransferase complex dimerization subunit type 1 TsaB [Oscillospiraceae bacterium]